MMNTAIIGTGFMGANHARIYSQISNLVAVCDVDKQRAEQLAKQYHCKSYTDYKEMLKKEKLDAVSIVVPTSLHYPIAMDVIDAGIPVMIEKPIASTIPEGEKIVQKAKAKKVPVLVGHIERFNPVIQTAKSILDKKILGDILSVRAVRVGPFTPRVKDAGALTILGIHDLDIFEYLVAEKIQDIHCVSVDKKFSQFEDIANVVCTFGNGAVGSLDVSWTSPKKIRTLTVTGTKGILELDYLTQELILTETGTPKLVQDYSEFLFYNVVGEQRLISVSKEEPLRVELVHFLDCVKDGKPPLMSGEDAVRALRLVDQCLQSAKSKH